MLKAQFKSAQIFSYGKNFGISTDIFDNNSAEIVCQQN